MRSSQVMGDHLPRYPDVLDGILSIMDLRRTRFEPRQGAVDFGVVESEFLDSLDLDECRVERF